jgi:transcriptional regulator with XRE-family HTH domain
MVISDLLRDARVAAGLTQSQLARASGTSQATLSAYEHGHKSPSASTLARILAAAGARLTTVPASRPVRVPRAEELEERGEILTQVLDFAERFPTRRGPHLEYPPLRTVVGVGR